jgi:hypothetical protein
LMAGIADQNHANLRQAASDGGLEARASIGVVTEIDATNGAAISTVLSNASYLSEADAYKALSTNHSSVPAVEPATWEHSESDDGRSSATDAPPWQAALDATTERLAAVSILACRGVTHILIDEVRGCVNFNLDATLIKLFTAQAHERNLDVEHFLSLLRRDVLADYATRLREMGNLINRFEANTTTKDTYYDDAGHAAGDQFWVADPTLLLCTLLAIWADRPRIAIMSATVHADAFAEYILRALSKPMVEFLSYLGRCKIIGSLATTAKIADLMKNSLVGRDLPGYDAQAHPITSLVTSMDVFCMSLTACQVRPLSLKCRLMPFKVKLTTGRDRHKGPL